MTGTITLCLLSSNAVAAISLLLRNSTLLVAVKGMVSALCNPSTSFVLTNRMPALERVRKGILFSACLEARNLL